MIWSFLSHCFCFVSSSSFVFVKAAKWLVGLVVVTGEKWNSCSGQSSHLGHSQGGGGGGGGEQWE